VGTRLIAKLAAAGHSVINCTPTSAVSLNDSLRKRANKANSNNVDIFVSIHFNAFNTKAMGAEVYGISQTSQAIAKSVLTEIVKLGFKNRGVKNTRFSVLVNTSMPAILIECCFVDSQADMALFDAEKMAEAIKVGLIGDAEDNSTPEPATLRITQKTVLKPSTDQSSELEASTLFEIEPGDYPVLDVRREERHFFVKWPDKSFGNRDEHFVFEEVAKIV
jgi:N-acetylmuramoyl-L-alanine amidase